MYSSCQTWFNFRKLKIFEDKKIEKFTPLWIFLIGMYSSCQARRNSGELKNMTTYVDPDGVWSGEAGFPVYCSYIPHPPVGFTVRCCALFLHREIFMVIYTDKTKNIYIGLHPVYQFSLSVCQSNLFSCQLFSKLIWSKMKAHVSHFATFFSMGGNSKIAKRNRQIKNQLNVAQKKFEMTGNFSTK